MLCQNRVGLCYVPSKEIDLFVAYVIFLATYRMHFNYPLKYYGN